MSQPVVLEMLVAVDSSISLASVAPVSQESLNQASEDLNGGKAEPVVARVARARCPDSDVAGGLTLCNLECFAVTRPIQSCFISALINDLEI